MALETVLLSLLGVVALWLAVDACRERHRPRARMDRAEQRARPSEPKPIPPRPAPNTGGIGPGSWNYWPMALPATDNTPVGGTRLP